MRKNIEEIYERYMRKVEVALPMSSHFDIVKSG